MIETIYDLGFFLSHQMIQSSHFFNGLQFPVAGRHVGMQLGFLIGLLSLYLTGDYKYRKSHWYVLLFIVPLGIDGVTQSLGLRESNFYLRVATGLIFGVGMAYVFNSVLRDDRTKTIPSKYNLFLSFVFMIPAFFMTIPFITGAYHPLGWIFFWLISFSIPLLALYVIMAIAKHAYPFFKNMGEKLDALNKHN